MSVSTFLARNPFGTINPPPGVVEHGKDPAGLISFFNVGLKLLVVGGGIYFLFNLIFAGYQFMSAQGDPKNVQNAWGKIWQSLVGLLMIAGSFLLAAILGQLIFGDAAAILNPSYYVPEK